MHMRMRHRLLSIVALAAWACQPAAKVLDTLVIEGLSIHQPAVVRNNVPLTAGREFTTLDVQEAIKGLSHLGLFSAIDFYVLEETDTSASLLLEVKEHPVCEAVEFHGNKKLKDRDLEEKVTISEGRTVSDAEIYENVRIIKEAYADKGYLLADVTCELIETKVPGNVIAKFEIDEGRRVKIKEITFEGNEAYRERKLKRKFKTKENKWYTSGEFHRDEYEKHLDTLMMFYHDQGYLDAHVVRDSVWYHENNRHIFINIVLDEGPQYYVGEFFFTGNKVLESDALASAVQMKQGKPFNKSKFEIAKMMISNAYREEGYLWVQLKEQFRRQDDTIDVVFDIVEGRPAIVRKIQIRGNEKTFEKVVRRELVMYPGQKYKQSRMERSVREVMQLNYFDNVTPDLKPNEDGTIDLVLDVQEKENIGQFSAGVMYSQVEGFGGNFSVSVPNFRGAGQEVSLTAEFSRRYQRYAAGFVEPWIFDTPTRFSTNIYYRRQLYRGDEYKSYGVEFGLGRRLKWPDDYFRIFANYGISQEDATYALDTVDNIIMLDEGILSRVWLKLLRDDTDLPNFPTRGSVFSMTGELAGVGGDYHYVKGTIGYDWYFPLFWKFVLGANSEFGLLGSVLDTIRILKTDLLSAGGVYYGGQLRGYPEESFGGRFQEDRGKAMLTLSSQIRFPILDRQLYFAVFGDMGNTWGGIEQVDPTDLYTGVGFGLRLLFPMIGLMGFDFAWGLDDPRRTHFENDAHGFEFHFLMNRGF
ncbi:MAG: outer membrane protein assembly factor BamA [Chitinivibrionales bacterium]|nr:outer membrane protein assembly factor BamA [Chitinivibrionales bacterium]MBD3395265.1 outer membrane protein assembly factor BamA [Chitinivibrionales bacterium]